MASVTSVVSKTKQPYGGYLPIKCFEKEVFDDYFELNKDENIHASLIGLAVDYLTRFEIGNSAEEAFHVSCLGARNIGMLGKAKSLMANITGLDDHSIISACKLAGFDVCYRSSPASYKPVESILPDIATIENIRIMVWRSVAFWDKYGPVVCSEPTFEGGYTNTVDTGDGDFLSGDTLWDFKVSKSAPTTKHSLQLLMYYIMGMHSVHDHFKNIENIGFFNPRLNIAYVCPVSRISEEIVTDIENNVICYGDAANVPSEAIEEETPEEFCVRDICYETGLKKGRVLSDIRSGKLIAYKKRGKYCIDEDEAWRYIERKRTESTIIKIFSAVFAAALVLILATLLVLVL